VLVTAAGIFLTVAAAALWLPSLLDRCDPGDSCGSANCPCSDCAIFAVVEQARRDVDEGADFREWEAEVSS